MMHNPYTVSLFTAHTGALSVRLDHEDGTFIHLHSLVDPENEAHYFSTVQFWGDRIILAGGGLGYHLRMCCSSIAPDAKILLLEFHDELAVYSAKLISDTIGNELIVVTGTEDNWQTLINKFIAGGKYIQVFRHPPSFKAHESFYRSILSTISPKSLERRERSFILMDGGFFVEQEVCAAAKVKNVACTLFHYKEYQTNIQYEASVQKMIQTARPGAIISINMLGIDTDGILMEYAQHYGIPVVIWFVDDPRPILLNRKNLVTPDMIAFSWERAYHSFLRNCGFDKVNYLPLAADPEQFKTVSNITTTINLGFIGSSMGKAFLEGIAAKFIWKPGYESIASVVSGAILDGYEGDIDGLLEDEIKKNQSMNSSLDEHTLTWLRSYCIHSASMMKRQRYISALQPIGIEVFGDPEGWGQLCGLSLIRHPDIDYRTEAVHHYRAIRVNVNITSCQMPTAVNQRVFDVPLCNSFIINDDQEDLGELFSMDEYECYHTPQELIEKVQYFQQHDTARNMVIQRARTRILSEHTYSHRLSKIIENL